MDQRSQRIRASAARNIARVALGFGAALATSALAAAPAYRVYVTNEGSGDVSVIDGAQGKVVGTYPLGKRPRGIAASPDGTQLYIALSGSPLGGPGVDESKLPPADKAADGVAVLDAGSGALLRVLTGASDPEQLAVASDGSKLFIASEDTGRAVILRVADSSVLATLAVGGEPEGVATSARAGIAGVTSESGNTVTLLDAGGARAIATLPVGQRPRDLVFTSDGSRLFVSGENDASLTVIDVPARKVAQTVRLAGDGARPKGLALSADGSRLYVTTGRGRRVLALDAHSMQVLGSALVGERPWGVALSPDGRLLYTANGPSNDVSVVDAATMRVLATIPVGTRPWGVAVVPVAAPAAPAYRVTQAVNLGAPERWDYVTYDEGTHDVFVSHGDRVTVVDGRDGHIVANIAGMPGGTHGVAISSATGQGFTDDGGEGEVAAFSLSTLAVTRKIHTEKDADGMALEPVTGQLFVVDAEPGHLTVIDPQTDTVSATINVGAALEFLVVDGKGKVYVNGEARNEIVRVDARTRRVEAHWPMHGCESPHGLAIDRAGRRLFSSCANGVLAVVDADSGALVATVPIGQGTDATAFDPKRKRIYSSNGRDGTITVIAEKDPRTYAVEATIKTAVTGRTMGIDPASGRLYVAAAEIDASAAPPPPGTPQPRRPPLVPGSLRLLFIDPQD